MAADDNSAGAGSRLARLVASPPFLLDGAMGTELERRGVRSDLPLWSSWGLLEAPGVVREVHRDYVAAGVDVLTAATFRTHARSLAAAGCAGRAAELCALAVRLAGEAAATAAEPPLVLGSAAPLEDCYEPGRVPGESALAREHAAHARHLVRAGADGILIETINTVREGVAALRAAREAGAQAIVSFVCGDGARLLSGEPLAAALEAVAPLGPLAVGVNCLPPRAAGVCLPPLRSAGLPFVVYANLGAPGAPLAATPDEATPGGYAARALGWLEAGAAGVGGCCGTGPAHLRALARHLGRIPRSASE